MALKMLLILASCAVFAYAQVQPRLTLEPYRSAQSISQIVMNMDSPTGNVVYCIADTATTGLVMRFTCPDCNETLNVDQMLSNNRQDQSQSAGFPVLKLGPLKAPFYLNGRTLRCEVQYETTGDSQPSGLTQADAKIQVVYMRKPVVVDSNNSPPLKLNPGGNRFYVECNMDPTTRKCRSSSGLSLNCAVDANPQPSKVWWTGSGGQTLGSSSAITINTQNVGESIQCHAQGSDGEERSSDAVKIDPFDRATVLGTNFDELKRNTGVMTSTGQVQLSRSVNMKCYVSGTPSPVVYWMKEMNGKIYNASCGMGNQGQPTFGNIGQQSGGNSNSRPQAPQQQVYYVENSCNINIQNYSWTGKYWCAACSQISRDSLLCSQENSRTRVGRSSLSIDVVGQPQLVQQDPTPGDRRQTPRKATVIPRNNGQQAEVRVVFCADPMPRPPRDLQWRVGDLTINVGDKKENFKAEQPQQNGTTPDCYVARLLIDPVREGDKDKTFQLLLRNQYGEERIDFTLEDVMGSGVEEKSGSAGWIIAIVIVVIIVLILLIIGCLWWRRACCFAPKKRPPEDKYASNVAPDLYKTEPAPPRQIISTAPTNGYHPSGEKRAHEGYNYAELDLVPDNRPPPTPQPSEYANMQQQPSPYVMKSSTNSVV